MWQHQGKHKARCEKLQIVNTQKGHILHMELASSARRVTTYRVSQHTGMMPKRPLMVIMFQGYINNDNYQFDDEYGRSD